MVDPQEKVTVQDVLFQHDHLLFRPVDVEDYKLGNVINPIILAIFVEEVHSESYEHLGLLV